MIYGEHIAVTVIDWNKCSPKSLTKKGSMLFMAVMAIRIQLIEHVFIQTDAMNCKASVSNRPYVPTQRVH